MSKVLRKTSLNDFIDLMIFKSNKKDLPLNFKQCQYIESNATNRQYIETNIRYDQNKQYDIRLKGHLINLTNSGTGWNAGGFVGANNSSFWYDGSLNQTNIRCNIMTDISIKIEKYLSSNTITTFSNQDGVATSIRKHSSIKQYSGEVCYPIFCYSTSGKEQTSFASMRVSYLKINNEVELVSAICQAGTTYIDGNTGLLVSTNVNKPGFYDLLNNRFYVNKGSGQFAYKLK